MCDLLDLVADDDMLGALVPVPQAPEVAPQASEATISSGEAFKGVSMKGRVGGGRHGNAAERRLLSLHMNGQKQARKDHTKWKNVLQTLKGSTSKRVIL